MWKWPNFYLSLFYHMQVTWVHKTRYFQHDELLCFKGVVFMIKYNK
jgi:hypothetical protein